MVSNPRWSHFSLSVKTLTYCFCFIFFFSLFRINLWNCYGWTHSFDIWHSCSLYVNLWPRYIPSKNLFGYLGKFPLGGGFIPIFRGEFYMEFFPPTSRTQSSELPSNEPRGIINAQAISRFLGLELKCSWRKAFNYELFLLKNKL